MIDPDLTDPENNDLIPGEDNGFSKEDMDNDLIPNKPPRPILTSILKELDNSDSVRVGNLLVQRKFLHGDGETGGEKFSILDVESRVEINDIKLSQLGKINTEEDLKDLMHQ